MIWNKKPKLSILAALLLLASPITMYAQTEEELPDTVFIEAQNVASSSSAGSPSNMDLGYYDFYGNLPQTPTGAALSKFGNHSVNYSIGQPEIKIPIYDLTVDDIAIPIYLEYQASGIKVNEPFSPYGAGWTLHAEPSITRSVIDLPDEKGCLSTPISSLYTDGFEWIYMRVRDKSPDMFNYRLFDRSGSFYFTGQGNESEVIVNPFEPLKVSYTYQYPTLIDFTIHDDNGLSYHFDRNAMGTNKIGIGETVDAEWKCSSVTSLKSGREVKFTYGSSYEASYIFEDAYAAIEYYTSYGEHPFVNSSSQYLTTLQGRVAVKQYDFSGNTIPLKEVSLKRFDNQNSDIQSGIIADIKQEIYPAPQYGSSINKNVLLTEISIDSIRIIFHYTPFQDLTMGLDTITVMKGSETIRKIDFYVSKMHQYVAGIRDADLCLLDSFRIENGGGVYKFSYYNDGTFPRRYSKARDFWGYYNGQNNSTLIPKYSMPITDPSNNSHVVSVSFGSANRNPSFVSTRSGSLRRITYPTGGWTQFDYELHKYKFIYSLGGGTPFTERDEGGGLRIESITDCNPTDSVILKRSYKYSDGRCKYPIVRVQYQDQPVPNPMCYNHRVCNYYYVKPNPYNISLKSILKTQVYYFPASPFSEFVSKYGSPVVYDTVEEIRSDGSKSVYYYDWGDSYNQASSKTIDYTFYINYHDSWLFGQPVLRRDFALKNGIYELVHSTGYTYDQTLYNTHNHNVMSSYVVFDDKRIMDNIDRGTFDDYHLPYPYVYTNNIHSGCNKLLEKRDSVFDSQGHATVTRTNYSYTFGSTKHDPLAYLRQSITTFSDSTKTIETTKYPTDLTLSGDKELARQTLVNQWLVNSPMEKSVSRNGHTLAVAGFDYSNTVVPRLTNLRFGKTSADRSRITYSDYTAYGKPQYKKVDGIQKTVFLYSYYGEYPVAVITGATFSEVTNAMGGLSEVSTLCAKPAPSATDWSKIENLKNSLSSALVTVYRYKPYIGISRITAPGTAPIGFDYDQIGRLTDSWLLSGSSSKLLEHNSYNYMNK